MEWILSQSLSARCGGMTFVVCIQFVHSGKIENLDTRLFTEMLPRNGGVRGRGGKMFVLDTRKVILVAMALLFVSYFAVVNMFFSISAKDGVATDALSQQDQQAPAKILAVDEDGKQVPGEPETPPKQSEHKWVRNPDRQYVWLDVAIDDVFIGRVTAEVCG